MRGILVALGLAALAVGTASGQTIGSTAPAGTGQAVGTVTAAVGGGETQSVLVLRGGQVYALRAGDSIFAGDTVFTRTTGALRFNIGACDVGLGGQRQFVVPAAMTTTTCPGNVLGTPGASAGTALEYGTSFANVAVGVGGQAAVGAAPALLAGVLAVGGALAAVPGDPASP